MRCKEFNVFYKTFLFTYGSKLFRKATTASSTLFDTPTEWLELPPGGALAQVGHGSPPPLRFPPGVSEANNGIESATISKIDEISFLIVFFSIFD